MRPNFRQQQTIKFKCNKCDSENIKKKKNFSHGTRSGAKKSYICKDCGSTDVKQEQNRRNFRKK